MQHSDNVVALRPEKRPFEQPDSDATSPLEKMRRMLKEESLHEHEAIAYVDEQEFNRRFALTWAKRERGLLLDFQQMRGISDRDIRWLARSGSLQVDGNAVRLVTSKFLTLYGWFCIVSLWLFLGLPLFGGAYLANNQKHAFVAVAIGTLFLVAATLVLWRFYVLPIYLQKKWARQRLQ